MQIPGTNEIFYRKIATTPEGYIRKIETEYQVIRKHLPKYCEKAISVDSGLSGINIKLFAHYLRLPYFYILNYPEQYYDQEKRRILDIQNETTKLMRLNGINNFKIMDLRGGIPLSISDADIIISTSAWGKKYEVDRFIDQAIPVMRESGTIILDISKDSKGVKTLAEYFKSVNIIKSGKTTDKVVASEIKY